MYHFKSCKVFWHSMIYLSYSKNHLWPSHHCSHKHVKKKFNTHATGNIDKDWRGQQSVKEALNHQKLYTIQLAWPWRVQKSMFCFHTPKGNCVTCVCLQYSRLKQNRHRSLAKPPSIHFTREHFKTNPSSTDKCKQTLRQQIRGGTTCTCERTWFVQWKQQP